MRLIYISHPLTSGGFSVGYNMNACTAVARKLYKEYPSASLVSPLHNYSFLEPGPATQEKALSDCLDLLANCDDIVMCGNWWDSDGCMRELKHAEDLGLNIIYETEGEPV